MAQDDQREQAATSGADPVERSTALTKFDPETLKNIVPAPAGAQRAVFLPASFGEALEMSKMLASGIGVRPWCRGNVSACMMIVTQAVRWGMDPYAVANKAYFVNDQVAFEAQLVNAVVNTSREIVGRLKIAWEGTGDKLVCTVTGHLAADPDDPRVLSQKISTITVQKSPLWKVNPEQQLAYFTTRAWARLYVPEVLLGVYTPDEVADGAQAMLEAKIEPGTAAAPDRRAFVAPEGEEAEYAAVEDEETAEVAENAVPATKKAEKPEKSTETASKPVAATVPDPEIPSNDEEWGLWERGLNARMIDCETVAAITVLRTEAQPVFAHAPKRFQDRLNDAFADNIAELAG